MKLIVAGSGSSGNSYILTNGEEALVLDAGLPFMTVKKALDFNVRCIKGVVVTHSHGDHAKYAREYEEVGIPVWKPYEDENLRQSRQLGSFTIRSFEAVHNVPCVGYLIQHEEIGRMLYVTDTEYVPFRFKGLSTMLIEMNYSDEYIDRNAVKFRHVLQGHLEKQTALDCIRANMNENLVHIILCHLSPDGSNEIEFMEAVKGIVPGYVTVDVARPGLTVGVDNIPF